MNDDVRSEGRLVHYSDFVIQASDCCSPSSVETGRVMLEKGVLPHML